MHYRAAEAIQREEVATYRAQEAERRESAALAEVSERKETERNLNHRIEALELDLVSKYVLYLSPNALIAWCIDSILTAVACR